MKLVHKNHVNLLIMLVMVLAMAFTISCSGDDGSDGTNGTNGTDGRDGTDCSMVQSGNGPTTITCGGNQVTIPLCGGGIYNPATQFCDARDGKAYKFVDLSGQIWMAENLNYAADDSKCYGDSPANCGIHGSLYLWETAKTACPAGWSLPTRAEWNALRDFAGGDEAGKHLKATSWTGGLDTYGFAALQSGFGVANESKYVDVGAGINFWSATEYDSYNAYRVYLTTGDALVETYENKNKTYLFSVRCIKN
jgi:uncharacterized protein (TIGR02145 family)